MKAKFGAIVVAGSGKIGGHVMSRNRHGAYMRTKVTPINPQSQNQLIVRNRLATLATAWRSLTQTARNAWNAAVSDFQKTDVFGDLKSPSGFNLFQRLNNNLAAIGLAANNTPPSPISVLQTSLDTFDAVFTGNVMELEFADPIPLATSVKLFVTPQLSPGINFVKSEYRLLSIIPAAAAGTISIVADYNARFGSLIAGQKVFAKVVFVDEATGIESLPQELSTIVAA